MNNKNWNDRADKDLFFTILSVKNIGVISGAEWTTIGNHMRGLGYGFTNEGCRYVGHFTRLMPLLHPSTCPWHARCNYTHSIIVADLTAGHFSIDCRFVTGINHGINPKKPEQYIGN